MATATATKPGATSRSQVSQMTQFTWTGKDKRGITMRGEVLSKNANLVKAELRKQGITPTVVAAKRKPLLGGAGKRITAREIAIFSRQLATMMQSGVPMVQSFEIIAGGQKNPRMKDLVTSLKTEVESGSSLN